MTTFVNPAALATDTGTSTLVEGFAAGTRPPRQAAGGGPNDPDNGCADACRDDEIQSQLSHEHVFPKKRRAPEPDRARGDSIRMPVGFGEEDSRTERSEAAPEAARAIL